MGSLSLQTIVNMWQRFYLFFKVYTKGYVVNSCLAPPLNTDTVKQWAIHQPAALTSYERLGCGYARNEETLKAWKLGDTCGALGPKNKRIYFGCPSSLLHAKYAQLNCTTFQQITAIIAVTIMWLGCHVIHAENLNLVAQNCPHLMFTCVPLACGTIFG